MEFHQEKLSTLSPADGPGSLRHDKQQPIIIQNFDLPPQNQLKFKRKSLSTANLYLSAASLSRKAAEPVSQQHPKQFVADNYPTFTTANFVPGMNPPKQVNDIVASVLPSNPEKDHQSRRKQVTFVDICSESDSPTSVDKAFQKETNQSATSVDKTFLTKTSHLATSVDRTFQKGPSQSATFVDKTFLKETNQSATSIDTTFLKETNESATSVVNTSLKRSRQCDDFGTNTDKIETTQGNITKDPGRHAGYGKQSTTKVQDFTFNKRCYQAPSKKVPLNSNTLFQKLSELDVGMMPELDDGMMSSRGLCPVKNNGPSKCKDSLKMRSDIYYKTSTDQNLEDQTHLTSNEHEHKNNKQSQKECLMSSPNPINKLPLEIFNRMVSEEKLAENVEEPSLESFENSSLGKKKKLIKSKRVSFKTEEENNFDNKDNNNCVNAEETGSRLSFRYDQAESFKTSSAKIKDTLEDQNRRWKLKAAAVLLCPLPASSLNKNTHQSTMSSDVTRSTTLKQLRKKEVKEPFDNFTISGPEANRLIFLKSKTDFSKNIDVLNFRNKCLGQKYLPSNISSKQKNSFLCSPQMDNNLGTSDNIRKDNTKVMTCDDEKHDLLNKPILRKNKSKSELNSEFLMKIYSVSGERIRNKGDFRLAPDHVTESATLLKNPDSEKSQHMTSSCPNDRNLATNSSQTSRKDRLVLSATSFGSSQKQRPPVRFSSARVRTADTRDKMAAAEQFLFLKGRQAQERTSLNRRLEQLIVDSLGLNK